MEPLTIQSATSSALENLVADALVHVEGSGYCAATLSIYRGVWSALICYSCSGEETEPFSEGLCARFLASREVPVGDNVAGLSSRKRQLRTAVRVLLEFAEHGCFRRRRCRTAKVLVCAAFRQALGNYLKFSDDYLAHSQGTLRLRRYNLTDFLQFLESQGVQSLNSISAQLVTQFVGARDHLASASVQNYLSALRSFLRYLWMDGVIAEDFSARVPTIRQYRHARIPSVWTRAEVDAILGSVNRGSPQGRRDYAILLLACRLGMRAGDIRALRLEYLLWDEARIEIAQAKTGDSLSLPMSEEIGHALIDYLRHGRPTSRHREVFLRLVAPYEPFGTYNNLHGIISLYLRRAGIAVADGHRRGMHSLRHTVASRLLEGQTPIETIADILGHRSVESTRVYTKVDISALRTVALDPQEVCDA